MFSKIEQRSYKVSNDCPICNAYTIRLKRVNGVNTCSEEVGGTAFVAKRAAKAERDLIMQEVRTATRRISDDTSFFAYMPISNA